MAAASSAWRQKIMMVVEPVVLEPLRREFDAVRARVAALMAGRDPTPVTRQGRRRERLPTWEHDAEAEWRMGMTTPFGPT